MTVRVRAKFGRRRRLAAGLGLVAVLAGTGLAAGCGVATPGTADYAGGPSKEPPTHLSAFPQPDVYVGGVANKKYQAVVRAVSGTAARDFAITATARMVLWLGCAGTAGTATLTSPA